MQVADPVSPAHSALGSAGEPAAAGAGAAAGWWPLQGLRCLFCVNGAASLQRGGCGDEDCVVPLDRAVGQDDLVLPQKAPAASLVGSGDRTPGTAAPQNSLPERRLAFPEGPECINEHKLQPELRRLNFCDSCHALGTAYSCPQRCDYDMCQACFQKAATCLESDQSYLKLIKDSIQKSPGRGGQPRTPGPPDVATPARAQGRGYLEDGGGGPGLLQSEMEYRADNSMLRANSRGLRFCLSKRLEDKDPRALLPWGACTCGVDLGDGWLQVGDLFLPTAVDGVPVLIREATQQAGPAGGEQAAKAEPAAAGELPAKASPRQLRGDKIAGAALAMRRLKQAAERVREKKKQPQHQTPSPAVNAEVLEESMPEAALGAAVPTVYLVDNGKLRAETQGLRYRFSKHLDNRDRSTVLYWGSVVSGIDEGDGWVQIGDRFVPTHVNGVEVLTEVMQMYEGLWARSRDGLRMGRVAGGLLEWSRELLPEEGYSLRTAQTPVAVACCGELTMELRGTLHVGQLVDGKLLWSDGEEWIRVPEAEAPKRDLSNLAMSDQCTAADSQDIAEKQDVASSSHGEDESWQGAGESPQARLLPDGSRYIGDWAGGRPEGQGTLVFPGGDTYKGQFLEGAMHGEGFYQRREGSGDPSIASSYRGQWHAGLKDGYGTEEWSNGARFEGFYRAGQMHGGGAYVLPSGTIRRVL
mmetsp:Transcript_44699/g.127564  ORF Transcript_44699/g.127564 Transcript_44699/m.127564 type:complete len:696 (+) Transcript_44699:121-2208(+)